MKALWILLFVFLADCGGKTPADGADVQAAADSKTDLATSDLDSMAPDTRGECEPDLIDEDSRTCAPPKPFLLDGACVECMTSEDCPDGLSCNPENHRCEVEECSWCEPPYPVCVQIDGVWSCVQCKYDEDCPAGVPCDEDLHACVPWPIDDFCPPCDSDADCVTLNQGLVVECHSASGCCFDRHGRCDGLSAGCPEGTCVQIWEELGCGTTSDPLELPCSFFPPGLGVCTCAKPFLIPRFIPCPDEDCGLGCPGEAACVDPSFIEDFGISIQPVAGICFPVNR